MRLILRAARSNSGITQSEIAEAMGVSCSTVSHWETGKAKMSKADVELFAKICGVTADDIFLPCEFNKNESKVNKDED